ncbi:hypothetical protein V8E53_004558, partial [Lactarius tabidus]
ELRDVLKIFKDMTLFFSHGTPNLATIIPAMDHIDKVLATMSNMMNREASLFGGSTGCVKQVEQVDSVW